MPDNVVRRPGLAEKRFRVETLCAWREFVISPNATQLIIGGNDVSNSPLMRLSNEIKEGIFACLPSTDRTSLARTSKHFLAVGATLKHLKDKAEHDDDDSDGGGGGMYRDVPTGHKFWQIQGALQLQMGNGDDERLARERRHEVDDLREEA
ncbi:hypothetical protein MKZ38_007800 [Zalerion maritima]|uniref:F-box domain-containing protein n=1 Tax=Zalerion maritima TaxID=339359 RepID=A0AAD5RIL4_9PEZI|nr:hypothetical protein MKZ38_007800 [Zalerion maritima]